MKKPLAALCAAALAASLLPASALAYRIPESPVPCLGGAVLVSSKTNDGTVTNYTVDSEGRVTAAASTDAEGFRYTHTYTYDAKGRVAAQGFTNDAGANDTTTYSYDGSGRLAKSVYVSGDDTLTLTYKNYDARNYPQTVMGNPENITYTYDSQGNVTKQVIGLNRELITYDTNGNPLTVTDIYDEDEVASAATEYTYDKYGNVLTATTTYSDGSEPLVTEYTYDYSAIPAPKVKLSTQNLKMDGKSIDCEKYNVDGANYFKLRDLACILRFTDSQFSVSYIAETNTVAINLGDLYEPDGTELITGTDKSATGRLSSQNITVNGEPVTGIEAYNIGGNNYFKLRDVANVIGFGVDYDEATRTAIIDSDN